MSKVTTFKANGNQKLSVTKSKSKSEKKDEEKLDDLDDLIDYSDKEDNEILDSLNRQRDQKMKLDQLKGKQNQKQNTSNKNSSRTSSSSSSSRISSSVSSRRKKNDKQNKKNRTSSSKLRNLALERKVADYDLIMRHNELFSNTQTEKEYKCVINLEKFKNNSVNIIKPEDFEKLKKERSRCSASVELELSESESSLLEDQTPLPSTSKNVPIQELPKSTEINTQIQDPLTVDSLLTLSTSMSYSKNNPPNDNNTDNTTDNNNNNNNNNNNKSKDFKLKLCETCEDISNKDFILVLNDSDGECDPTKADEDNLEALKNSDSDSDSNSNSDNSESIVFQSSKVSSASSHQQIPVDKSANTIGNPNEDTDENINPSDSKGSTNKVLKRKFSYVADSNLTTTRSKRIKGLATSMTSQKEYKKSEREYKDDYYFTYTIEEDYDEEADEERQEQDDTDVDREGKSLKRNRRPRLHKHTADEGFNDSVLIGNSQSASQDFINSVLLDQPRLYSIGIGDDVNGEEPVLTTKDENVPDGSYFSQSHIVSNLKELKERESKKKDISKSNAGKGGKGVFFLKEAPIRSQKK